MAAANRRCRSPYTPTLCPTPPARSSGAPPPARYRSALPGQTRVTSHPGQLTSRPGQMTSRPGQLTSLPGQMTSPRGRMTSRRHLRTSLPGQVSAADYINLQVSTKRIYDPTAWLGLGSPNCLKSLPGIIMCYVTFSLYRSGPIIFIFC